MSRAFQVVSVAAPAGRWLAGERAPVAGHTGPGEVVP